MPSTFAPILMRQGATSPISGSRAAFSITVSPLARAAARRTLCVAPTETFGNTMRAPRNPFGAWQHIAAVDIDLGAELFQAHEMQIDRPRADGAAAGQRDLGLSHAGDQRPEHPEAGPHRETIS